MSYFVSDYAYDSERSSFKSMYGNDASFIKPTNMMEVARTMNQVSSEVNVPKMVAQSKPNTTLCVRVVGE